MIKARTKPPVTLEIKYDEVHRCFFGTLNGLSFTYYLIPHSDHGNLYWAGSYRSSVSDEYQVISAAARLIQ